MKQLKYSHAKTFHYDNAEERLNHIKEMEQDGWTWRSDNIMAKKKYKRLERYQCPRCGSTFTNKVSYLYNFCTEWDIEFNVESNRSYDIQLNGELVEIV